jgi:hypothetical protein
MIVKLRKSRAAKYRDLRVGREYLVIGIEADDYRLLSDQGRPFLYPATAFEVTDSTPGADWEVEEGKDGEHYAYPAPLGRPGFFEDFFDGKPKAITEFWRAINTQLVHPVREAI